MTGCLPLISNSPNTDNEVMIMKRTPSVILTITIIFSLINSQLSIAQTLPTEFSMEQRTALFNYNKTTDLDINEIGSEKRGSVTILDITFVGIEGKQPVKAYLVLPKGPGPHAGILWGHWLGHHTSNRNQYLDEAVNLASKGVVSLLIAAMWAAPSWYENRVLEKDYNNSIEQVLEIRRAMDLLMSYKNVDTARIAYVGHDYSGMYGAIAAGVEPRAKTYVFIAVTSSLYNWAFFANQPKSKLNYVRQNAVFELTDYVGRINGSVFCQFSNRDPFIAKTDANVFYNAINSSDKVKKRYDADHDMIGDEIVVDRNAWLIKELGLKE
jgi:hypothetical protein